MSGTPLAKRGFVAERAQIIFDRICEAERQSSNSGKTASVAVSPCRKALPPTGPISPAQKKPARA
jgi:hypothetical protein